MRKAGSSRRDNRLGTRPSKNVQGNSRPRGPTRRARPRNRMNAQRMAVQVIAFALLGAGAGLARADDTDAAPTGRPSLIGGSGRGILPLRALVPVDGLAKAVHFG